MGLTKSELEELVTALNETDQDEPLSLGLSHEEITHRLYDGTWNAICHQTGRCGRFYDPTDLSPRARIYRLMSKALKVEETG